MGVIHEKTTRENAKRKTLGEEMTSWQRLLQDLRAHFVHFSHSEVRRKDLVSIAEIKYGLNPRRWTLDNYMRYLRKAGFLETVSPGV
jgi:hypothetical protein